MNEAGKIRLAGEVMQQLQIHYKQAQISISNDFVQGVAHICFCAAKAIKCITLMQRKYILLIT